MKKTFQLLTTAAGRTSQGDSSPTAAATADTRQPFHLKQPGRQLTTAANKSQPGRQLTTAADIPHYHWYSYEFTWTRQGDSSPQLLAVASQGDSSRPLLSRASWRDSSPPLVVYLIPTRIMTFWLRPARETAPHSCWQEPAREIAYHRCWYASTPFTLTGQGDNSPPAVKPAGETAHHRSWYRSTPPKR